MTTNFPQLGPTEIYFFDWYPSPNFIASQLQNKPKSSEPFGFQFGVKTNINKDTSETSNTTPKVVSTENPDKIIKKPTPISTPINTTPTSTIKEKEKNSISIKKPIVTTSNDKEIIAKTKSIPPQNVSHFIEIIADKNNIKFKTAKTNSCFKEEYPPHTDVCCAWCRHSFDTQPIGIPVKSYGTTYWMDGCFCSFECVFAFLLEHEEKLPDKRDPLYVRSIPLLHQLFSILSPPGSVLCPAGDWRLLEKVGTGQMTISQFRSSFFRFIRTSNIRFCSCQVYYQLSS